MTRARKIDSRPSQESADETALLRRVHQIIPTVDDDKDHFYLHD